MTLRTKTLLLIALTLLGLAALLYATMGTALLRSFLESEEGLIRLELKRARQALSMELEALRTTTTDWAEWDDSYGYMVSRSPQFEKTNLNLPTLRTIRVNVLALVAADGTVIWGGAQSAASVAIEPLPESVGRVLGPDASLCCKPESSQSRTGLLVLPEGILAVATRPVRASSRLGPSRGTLIMGRWMTGQAITPIRESWQVNVELFGAGNPATPADVLALPPPSRTAAPDQVRPIDATTLAAYGTIPDIDGKPRITMRVKSGREIYRNGLDVVRLATIALIASVACVGFLVVFIVERVVLSRIARLDRGIEAIAATGDIQGRVVLPGRDELAHLADEINNMLSAVESTGKQLKESEERYRRLVELSPDGIIIIASGKVAFGNRKAAELLGLHEPLGIFGQPALKFLHPRSRRHVARAVARLRDHGEAILLPAEKLIRADGTLVDVDIAAAPHSFEGHEAAQVVVRDITGRLRLEEQLVQAQKMEAVGRLAGGVAHDFNNILQAILSLSQTLRSAPPGSPPMSRALGELDAHVRRAAALTRQLLVFARRDVTLQQVVDLNEPVGEGLRLLHRLLRENIRLVVELHPEPLPVEVDPKRLEQVLLNLALNASDAMPEGGTLTVTTTSPDARAVALEVRDTGVGIPDELKVRIFEPFFTTKASEHGTGLGLSVVHAIVSDYGGVVSFDSQLGCGTTFRVLLPRTNSPLKARAQETAEEEVPAGRGERILVVEDETAARDGLRDVLHMLGYHVVTAPSGEDAEVLAAAGSFDVLLTDLLLPGIKGNELARRLRGRWPWLRVIIMSGYAPDGAMRDDVGVTTSFLQKPFDMATLAHEIRAVLSSPLPGRSTA